MKMREALKMAFSTLTILPVHSSTGCIESDSLYFYPVVGFSIGIAASFVSYLFSLSGLYALGAVIYSLSMVIITRGFHLDGLGDMADGFGGAFDKNRILEIMKDSRSGSFSVIAITMCLICKTVSAFYSIRCSVVFVLWACTVSRVCVVIACSVSEYAKDKGLSYNLVSGASASHSLYAVIQAAFAAVICILLLYRKMPVALLSNVFVISLIASVLAMVTVRALSYRKINGITGDILGAVCEICETVCLIACDIVLYR